MPEKIAVLKGPGIGDVTTAIPLLRNLRRGFPNAEIMVFDETSYGAGRKLLEKCPYIDKTIEISQKMGIVYWLKKIREIRKEKIDVIIDSFPSTRKTAIFCLLTGARQRVGYTTNVLHFLYTKNIEPGTLNAVDIGKRILHKLGVEPDNAGLELFLDTGPEKATVTKFLADNNIKEDDFLVAVHTGKTNDVVRTWPDERWAFLCDKLIDSGARVVFVGTEEDKDRTLDAVKKMKNKPAIFVGGRKIEETAAMLERAGLCITTNTGIMHIAAALHRPLIALCGITKPGWDPYGEKSIVIRKNTEIYRDTAKYTRGDNRYMADIGVEDVFAAVRSNIDKLRE